MGDESSDEEEVRAEWIGPSVLGPINLGKKKVLANVKKYEAISLQHGADGEFKCGLGDFVHILSEDDPFVGRLMELWEDSKGKKFATVQWLYRPQDVSKEFIPSPKPSGDEIFYALEHLDKIEADTILESFRIEFSLTKGGATKSFVSSLYSDKSQTVRDDFMYRCSRVFDLTSKVEPFNESFFKQMQKSLLTTFRGESSAEKSREKKSATKEDPLVAETPKKSVKAATTSTTTPSRAEPAAVPKKGEKDRHVAAKVTEDGDKKKPKQAAPKPVDGASKKKKKSVEKVEEKVATKFKKSKNVRGKVSDPKEEEVMPKRKIAKVVDEHAERKEKDQISPEKAVGRKDKSMPLDTDEKLFVIFNEARKVLGSDEALEVLGYVKLEMLFDNCKRQLGEQMSPPPFILAHLNTPQAQPFVAQVRQLLDGADYENDGMAYHSNPTSIRKSFAELEKCRPGVIFGLLGHGRGSRSNWLFPSSVTSPIFGSMLGEDGFRTCKMMYQKQVMHVPIEREGNAIQAAIHGFAKLVTSHFGFSLIRTGDFQFEVAPSPDETCDQIFVKTTNGRTLSLTVPVSKALLKFVKVLITECEGIPADQQHFTLGGKDIEENESILPLSSYNIKHFSTLHLVLKL